MLKQSACVSMCEACSRKRLGCSISVEERYIVKYLPIYHFYHFCSTKIPKDNLKSASKGIPIFKRSLRMFGFIRMSHIKNSGDNEICKREN